MMKTERSAVDVCFRTFLGSVAGYYFATLTALFVTHLMQAARAEAVIAGVLLSFAVHTLVIVAAFLVRSIGKLAAALLVCSALMLAVIRLLPAGSA